MKMISQLPIPAAMFSKAVDMPSHHNGLCWLKLWVKDSPVFKWLLPVYLSTAESNSHSWALTASLSSSPTSTQPALCVLGILSHWTVSAHTVGLHRLFSLLGASFSVSSWPAWYSKLFPSSRSNLVISDYPELVPPSLDIVGNSSLQHTPLLSLVSKAELIPGCLRFSFPASLGISWGHHCIW